MTILDDPTSRSFACLAGALYLVIGVTGVYAILWVPARLTVPGDALETFMLITQHPGLFATGVGADIILMMAEILLAIMLYAMFRSHGPVIAMTATAARLIIVAVMAVMLLPEAGTLILATSDVVPVGLDDHQRVALAWLLRQIHDTGILVWQAFFAMHLWLLGVLAWHSGCVPRLLASGLTIGGTGYLFASIRDFHFVNLMVLDVATTGLLGIAALAEISFALWLLVRGRIPAKAGGGAA